MLPVAPVSPNQVFAHASVGAAIRPKLATLAKAA